MEARVLGAGGEEKPLFHYPPPPPPPPSWRPQKSFRCPSFVISLVRTIPILGQACAEGKGGLATSRIRADSGRKPVGMHAAISSLYRLSASMVKQKRTGLDGLPHTLRLDRLNPVRTRLYEHCGWTGTVPGRCLRAVELCVRGCAGPGKFSYMEWLDIEWPW